MGIPINIEYRMLIKTLSPNDRHGHRKFIYQLNPEIRIWLKQQGIRATFKANPEDARMLSYRVYLNNADGGRGTLWFKTSYDAILFKMNINNWDHLK